MGFHNSLNSPWTPFRGSAPDRAATLQPAWGWLCGAPHELEGLPPLGLPIVEGNGRVLAASKTPTP